MKKLLILFILIGYFASAQTDEHLSSFNMVSFTYKHDKKWMAYIELQDRAIEEFSKPDYYEVKGGIGYNIDKNNQPFIGIGRYGTYKESKFYQEEFRIWLQYIFSQKISKLKIDHRLRAEKRFFYFPQSGLADNTSRFRYRMALTLPLNKDKIEPNTFFLNAFEEVFAGPNAPNFKRNRLFGGFGYQLNDYIGANMGYMWQREFANSGNRSLHFLYFALNFTFDRLKYNEMHQIPVAD
ncbi:DUF2490 domain-containing protein [Cloacibacterium sp.]|uniref:DUF2490 domain-containing protein n=1 Tax=Cloacibacterium sp. TaxID=1913682 RepID=UPI0039E3C1DD